MAVQVPGLNRFQETAPPSVGRLEVRAPDLQQAIAPQQKAFGNLVEKGADAFLDVIKQKADTEGLKSANEMQTYLNRSLTDAKQSQDDPTHVYQQLDESEEKKFAEIRDRYKDATSETQAAVQDQLLKSRQRFNDNKVSAYSVQNDKYQTTIANDGVKLRQYKMMDDTAHLDVSNPETTIPLDSTLAEIYDLRMKSAVKRGAAKEIRNEKGDVIGFDANPSVKVQIAKDRSEGLYDAINNLTASGDVEGAKFLQDKYKAYLLPDQKIKVEEKTKKAEIEIEAEREFLKVKDLPYDQAFDKLDNNKKNPEIRKKSLANLDTYRRQNQNREDFSSKKNYKYVGNLILERQNGGDPFVDVNQMLKDPAVKRTWDNIRDPKQKIALQHMIEQPKDSDPNQVSTAFTKLFNGEFRGMSPDDFNVVISGMSKSDRNKFTNDYKKFNAQTPVQELNQVKTMGTALEKDLDRLDYIKKNPETGRYSDKHRDMLIEAQQELTDTMEKIGQLTPQEQLKYVKQFAANKVNGEVFNKEAALPAKRFQGTITPKTKEDVVEANAPITETSKKELEKAWFNFKQLNKRAPTTPELLEYIKKQKGK